MEVLRKKDWFPNAGIPIAVERRDPQLPFAIHRHEFSEIVIITGGSGIHVTGNNQWELAAGDAFVISGSRSHGYRSLRKLQLINVLFDSANLPMKLSDLQSLAGYHSLFGQEPTWLEQPTFSSRLTLSPHGLMIALELIDELEEELRQKNSGFEIMSNVILFQLATHLSRCFNDTQTLPSQSSMGLAACLAYLEKNYRHPISLEDLIVLSGMSRRQFLRVFELTMQQSPIAFLIRLRIRHASRMLVRNERTISQIAFDVGFNDSNYFSRQFRALTGTTPREYRSRFKSKSNRPILESDF